MLFLFKKAPSITVYLIAFSGTLIYSNIFKERCRTDEDERKLYVERVVLTRSFSKKQVKDRDYRNLIGVKYEVLEN